MKRRRWQIPWPSVCLPVCLSGVERGVERERERAGQLDWGYNEKRQTGKETKMNGVKKLLLVALTGAELLLLTTRYLNRVCAQDFREKLESQIATAKKSNQCITGCMRFSCSFLHQDWFLHQSERSRKWDKPQSIQIHSVFGFFFAAF